MKAYTQTFVSQMVAKAKEHVIRQFPELDTEFFDVYLEQIDNDIKITVDEKGIPTNSTEEILKAFTAKVDADPELGTPEGMRILASVKVPIEEHKGINGNVKVAPRRGGSVRFNIFDGGVTKDWYNLFYGQLEQKNMKLVGNGIFEATGAGVYGRGMNVPLGAPFYMYDSDKNRLQGKRKLPDGTYTEKAEYRTATFRPMFFLQEELEALEARLEREVRRTHYVEGNVLVENIDTSEAEEIANKTGDTSKEAEIKPETAEQPAQTGTGG